MREVLNCVGLWGGAINYGRRMRGDGGLFRRTRGEGGGAEGEDFYGLIKIVCQGPYGKTVRNRSSCRAISSRSTRRNDSSKSPNMVDYHQQSPPVLADAVSPEDRARQQLISLLHRTIPDPIFEQLKQNVDQAKALLLTQPKVNDLSPLKVLLSDYIRTRSIMRELAGYDPQAIIPTTGGNLHVLLAPPREMIGPVEIQHDNTQWSFSGTESKDHFFVLTRAA